MDHNTTFILDEKGEEKHKFSYDKCYWSHDGFNKDDSGYFSPIDEYSPYAD